jgi:UDP-N-acetylmuramate dehydrogenase
VKQRIFINIPDYSPTNDIFTRKKMIIRGNVSLKKYNTFGLEYIVKHMVHARTEKEAVSLFNGSVHLKQPVLIMGGGSNLLFTRDFTGTIIIPGIKGTKIEEESDGYVIISAGAGVVWDSLVEWSVSKGYSGLENLSLIPGLTGAVPVQNIGAYGVEARETIYKVMAISTHDGSTRYFTNEECGFAYRNSIFKNSEKGNWLVTKVYFRLRVNHIPELSYGTLKDEVTKLGEASLKNLRQSVINIRRSKLPDPAVIGNAGSFFKNPVVDNTKAEEIKTKFPGLPCYYDHPGSLKLAAGWMIEQCGWKGKYIGDAGVHEKQALVLVNRGKATGMDILELSEKIRKSVFEKFGVPLEREVEII